MTMTEKFSQFAGPVAPAAGDIFAGLRYIGGVPVNYQFLWTGGGGGGATGVTTTITQATPLAIGNWVRVDNTGTYVPAQANSAEHAEVIGIVVATPLPNEYTIQQSGYITTAMGVVAGLVAGSVYFLDTATTGNMVLVDASVNGQVSRPVFVADSPTSGWVVPYRGLVVGGIAPNSGGGTTPVIPDIVTVNQTGHGLNLHNWVRVGPPNLGLMQPTYVEALADNLADSQSVGVITSVPNANQFILQFSGYVSGAGAPTVDSIGNTLIPGTAYYLDPVVLGSLTSTNPTIAGQVSKPVYICEQVGAGPNSTGVYAGYILPQRPEVITAPVVSAGWTLISTQTVAAVPTVNVTGITGFYRYMIVIENIIPVNNNTRLYMRTSSNNGASYDSAVGSYSWGSWYNPAGFFNVNDTQIYLSSGNLDANLSNVVARGGVSGTMTILNPANTTFNKTWDVLLTGAGNVVVNAYLACGCNAATRLSTAIMNAVQFYFDVGAVAQATVKLYGTNV